MTTSPPTNDFVASMVELHSPDGGRVKVTPYGAHVLSWITGEGDEMLFLSPKAEYHTGVAIRGGVPVIFPQFSGMGPLPKHGFARNQGWQVVHTSVDRAVFCLEDSSATRAIWPHGFQLEYNVHVENRRLELALSVSNCSAQPFTFTAALHTYLRVDGLASAAVLGLGGLRYLDSANGGAEAQQVDERVTFPSEVDRLYPGAPGVLRLVEAGRGVQVDSRGFPDAVVWNPGPELCAKMADMVPDGYLRFVCIEAAAAAHPVSLGPNETWQAEQILVRE